MSRPTLLWYRQDLRLADHPALAAATAEGSPVIPVYIWAPEEEGDWSPGSASRWWLHQSLRSLDRSLRERGSRLILRRGPVVDALGELCAQTGAGRIYFTPRYEPAARQQQERVFGALSGPMGSARVEAFPSSLLFEPTDLQTKDGRPFQVFTPFWKACLARPEPSAPGPAPRLVPAPGRWPPSLPLAELRLEPEVDWAEGLRETWEPGEAGAARRLRRFAGGPLRAYREDRDRPDLEGTSRLSPHLHFGEISPGQIWHAIRRRSLESRESGLLAGSEAFLREVGWREFAYHLLYHFPHTTDRALRPEFAKFPWSRSRAQLRAWQRGRTGYPLVDAGMRELWRTGWMHNRVRMVTASFLVKDLLISWREGARFFWDTLVDADLANNTLGWQWTAGCGADAAPYFRIFNPTTQSQKFDPRGAYLRRWIPELADCPQEWIHHPHDAPPKQVDSARGTRGGSAYPRPVIDHALARERALGALKTIRGR